MTNLEKVLFVLLFLAVAVLGYLIYGLNQNLAVIDQKGRNLREWARQSAVWSTHANNDHMATDHTAMKVAPSHIPPPPDPPPDW